jgi:hypothetical protein
VPPSPPLPSPPLPTPPPPSPPPPVTQVPTTVPTPWPTLSTAAYSCTSADQSVVVPVGVFTYYVEAWGAAGGGSNAEGYTWEGGCGGLATGYVPVVPGSTLTIEVGCGGRKTCSAEARPYPYGGLPSYRSGYCAGQGGGRSAVRAGSTYLVVASGARPIA